MLGWDMGFSEYVAIYSSWDQNIYYGLSRFSWKSFKWNYSILPISTPHSNLVTSFDKVMGIYHLKTFIHTLVNTTCINAASITGYVDGTSKP